jgi:tetratricopeptide (TPR) repeat protein
MWSRRSIEILTGLTLLLALAACSVAPRRAAERRPAAAAAHSAAGVNAGIAGKAGTGAGAPAAAGPPPVPAQAREDFDKALALAHGGNDAAAEDQLTSLAHGYPQFCTPLIDLGILERKDGHLDAAAKALQEAVARDPHNAVAWTELGVTQRLGGEFEDAEQSYGRAIAANPAYAPAWRDRGVLRDLYLDRPAAALGDFEQYRKLAAEDKPVVMWIAELEHRTGIKEPPGSEAPAATAGVSPPPPTPAAPTPARPPQARN